MKYVRPEIISLKNNSEFNEKWLQAKIEEDPSIIGLGDLEFRDTEKIQVGGGRLDTILYDPESKRRYEVEIQLGKTDESHIIRTIEYWDLERKKNPQYEHCAVIIAEDITSRFLNVISLFNGFIPLIAIQVKAIKVEDNISLFFTKVLDEVKLELLDEDTTTETTDRAYWEKKATKSTLKLMDKIFEKLNGITSGYDLKYNKYYIGLVQNNMANNFISFKPRKSTVIVNLKVEKTEELDTILENSDIDLLSYDNQWKLYRFRLTDNDLKSENSIEIMKKFAEKAKEEYRN
ncbi:hypothetical protein [Tenacibaculum maritimum]|uniref:hypothetical protein n=1 Tax=Tenacibaculum maritimum TaxID=107401 RepID=UPI0012E67016|nr:hypothetical protein [Tenacibaculum maritimum]MCD9564284.1 hypothetical protein [Tenacibaculum maritimum]MCD9567106.1 hypothetical protein [Tenacibaculum maritimum]MCD9580321.1 hypothetical protein [Tenacibaculum maritimum]MCD9598080.1 hypothetical protein [Tenacibaculum maritimum]MCD9614982.1 hypothetical protein [Tenacibaculum maritimum]